MKGLNKKFAFKLTNASGATKVVALIPGNYRTLGVMANKEDAAATVHYHNTAEMVAAGFAVDAILDDATIATGVVGSPIDTKFTIRQFLEYLQNGNVEVIKSITIQADDKSAYENQITLSESSPFGKNAESTINLTDYFGTGQFQDKKIVIDNVPIQCTDNTVMIMPIDTGRELIITYNFE